MDNGDIEEKLTKSRTTYQDLHRSSNQAAASIKAKVIPSDDSEDDDSTLPIFVNQTFSRPNTINNTSPALKDGGMFRAICGQVIIHHDHDRLAKVQCEEQQNAHDHDDDDDDDDGNDNDSDNENDAELENFQLSRTNGGNYELHYDIDNPLEISCSMSLSSAETSDHSPSPIRHRPITDDKNRTILKRDHIFTKPQNNYIYDDSGDDTPSSIISDDDLHEKNVIDRDSIMDQDEKLRTFRGWHLSMLKQIDEKLREIELETTTNTNTTNTNTITPANKIKRTVIKPLSSKIRARHPTVRRRFPLTNTKHHQSPIPDVKPNPYRSRTPSVEKESRTLIINLPPSPSSSSTSSDNEKPFPPPPAPSEPIHIRIVQSPVCSTNQRSQSTDRLILRDQCAQTEPYNNTIPINPHRLSRPASVECDRLQSTRSLTRTQGYQFIQQQKQQQQQQQQPAQRPYEQVKFYSLRSRNVQPRPSIVTQSYASATNNNRPEPNDKINRPVPPKFQSPPSADPSVYSDDYGHVTQMDTRNLGTLVDKVFDDIHQDNPSDFYRDYKQLLHDIQMRFSMIPPAEQTPRKQQAPSHSRPPQLPSFPSTVSQQTSNSSYFDYSQLSRPSLPKARLCDTLIYIPNAH